MIARFGSTEQRVWEIGLVDAPKVHFAGIGDVAPRHATVIEQTDGTSRTLTVRLSGPTSAGAAAETPGEQPFDLLTGHADFPEELAAAYGHVMREAARGEVGREWTTDEELVEHDAWASPLSDLPADFLASILAACGGITTPEKEPTS